jgi:AAA domain
LGELATRFAHPPKEANIVNITNGRPVIRKAERRKAKLRLAICGPTGAGKTMSALQLAFGLGGKIGLIDTEHGSGDLYAHLGDYDVITLDAPYTVAKYRDAIRAFEDAGYATIIVDSLSHAWAGEGGLLDKQGQLESSGRYKNSFATWREITPEHNKLVEEMLGSPAHIIATMRSKMEWIVEKDDRGRNTVRKVGLAPVQKDGVSYEFTTVLDVAENHTAQASKDRTSLFDGWCDRISPETGRMLRQWLDSGTEPVRAMPASMAPTPMVRGDVRPELAGDGIPALDDDGEDFAGPSYLFVTNKGGGVFRTSREWTGRWHNLISACRVTDAIDKLRTAAEMNESAIAAVAEFDPQAAQAVRAMLAEAIGLAGDLEQAEADMAMPL